MAEEFRIGYRVTTRKDGPGTVRTIRDTTKGRLFGVAHDNGKYRHHYARALRSYNAAPAEVL